MDYGVNFDQNDKPNFPLQTSPRALTGFVVSHAHLDHTGALPIYQISGSKPVFGTLMTKVITEVMLKDFLKLSAAHIPYEWVEVKKTMESFTAVEYGQEFEIGPFKVRLDDAGHIPGSAMITVGTDKGVVTYTGDINLTETKLSKRAEIEKLKDTSVVVMETTYGTFRHLERPKVEDEFVNAVKEVVEGGGTVLVPAFSLSRSQEVMAVLAEKNFPYPVYFDGMIRELTRMMLENRQFVNRYDVLSKAFETFQPVRGWEDRHKVWRERGVIVASAGMLKGGPSVYYFKRIEDNPRNAIFLVSYQGERTPGRRLLEMGKFDEQSKLLKARLQMFDFSSHAGKDQLLEILRAVPNLQKVVLVHGSEQSVQGFGQLAKEQLGVEVVGPENGQDIPLWS
ncbi:MBL fold metallo-hydrolase [Sulfodiicoccus acidiphilus]|nr:MBL fold metallo-hydrolase [Sulfodiicoccus acidiphilus]